jgi:hypothetical protein
LARRGNRAWRGSERWPRREGSRYAVVVESSVVEDVVEENTEEEEVPDVAWVSTFIALLKAWLTSEDCSPPPPPW